MCVHHFSNLLIFCQVTMKEIETMMMFGYLILIRIDVHYNHLITEFEGCTVSYEPSFFPMNLWLKCEVCRSQIKGEKRSFVTYSTDQEDKVSERFILLLLYVCWVRE